MPSFINVQAPYAFESVIELTVDRSILSNPSVLSRSVEAAAFPNISLKIKIRPELVLTVGSVNVL
jgi:hypothetical protein